MIANKTTTHLKLPDVRAWWNVPAPISLAICVVCTAGIIAAVGQIATTPAAVNPPPIIIIATPQSVAVPTAIPVQQVAAQLPAAPVRYVTAFAAPDSGIVLGPIPWDANSPILGRWGDSMIMTAWQGSNVWVRISELGGSLANLAPEVPQYQPAAPVYQVVNVEQPEEAVSTPVQQEAPQPPVDERTLLIQGRLANEHVQAQPTEPPTSGIFHQQLPTQVELQRLAWQMEHCTDPSDPRTCLP